MDKKHRNWLIMLVMMIGVALITPPQGMDPKAFWFLGIFVALVVGFILQPAPAGALTFMALTLCAVLKICTLNVAVAGWGSSVAWLVMSAFIIARGYIKTGLGRRIALLIVKLIGTSTLKLGYAFSFSEFLIGPAVPSYTARSGGIIFPIQLGICDFFGSKPGPTANRCGNYFLQLEHQMTNIVAAMFLTSSAINPLGISIVKNVTGLEISWPQWAMMCVVPGLVLVFTVPYIMYKLTNPEIKKTPEAPKLAEDLLKEMGPMSTGEKIQLAVFFGCIILWATSIWTKVDATAVALLGCSVLILTNTVTWKEAMSETEGWTAMITIGGLTGLSGLFSSLGIIKWLTAFFAAKLTGVSVVVVFCAIIVFYIYSHYCFASTTSHMAALMAPCLLLLVTAGMNPMVASFSMLVASSIPGALTHYASGPSPIFFGAGYCDVTTWWRNGFILSLIVIANWVIFGSLWWKFLGVM